MRCEPARLVTTLCAPLSAALLCMAAGCASAGAAGVTPGFWGLLAQGGNVLVLPHAGQSDNDSQPASRDCTSRQYLSADEQQRLQSLKSRMRSHRISVGRVLTSHDCRCIETAGILFGQAEPWSIIDDSRQADAKLADQRRVALLEAVSRWDSVDNLSIVTHQATIREAFGLDLAPMELLLIEPLGDAGFRIVGRLKPK